MPRDLESLIDIEAAAQAILRFSQGIEFSDLIDNEEKTSAILHQLTIIGEATKRLSMPFRQTYPEVPWRDLAGMRDIIVHQYDQIDFEVIVDVIDNELPQLLADLKPIIRDLKTQS